MERVEIMLRRIKINYIKDKNNSLLLFPLIIAILGGIILSLQIKNHQYNNLYIKELLLNMNSFMPAFLGIISKIIISFEEQTKNYNFVLSKSNRSFWINTLIINIYTLWGIVIGLIIIPIIFWRNNIGMQMIFNFLWSNLIVNFGWILIYVFLGIKLESNIDIFVGFLSIPFLTFYGLASMSKNIWKICPLLYPFKYGITISPFSIYSIIAISFNILLYIVLDYWFNGFEK